MVEGPCSVNLIPITALQLKNKAIRAGQLDVIFLNSRYIYISSHIHINNT